MKIAVGADHGGVGIKDAIVEALKSNEHEVVDFGTHGTESVDYPDSVAAVAPEIVNGQFELGILCCTSGIGVSIAANKYPGVRAAKVNTVEETVITRQHKDANILC